MSGNAPDPETLARVHRSLRLIRRGGTEKPLSVGRMGCAPTTCPTTPALPHEAAFRGPF